MTARREGKAFQDPYEGLADDEFEREVLEAIEQSSVKISLRVPKGLLERTKRMASERGVPYQTLMKALLDRGIQRLEQSEDDVKAVTRSGRGSEGRE